MKPLAIDRRLFAAFRFFFENAGYAVGQRALGAIELARAEQKAIAASIVFEWVSDDNADWSWMSEEEAKRDHEVYGCIAWRVTTCPQCGCTKEENVASLWSIFDPDSAYRRVVEAELALEALS